MLYRTKNERDYLITTGNDGILYNNTFTDDIVIDLSAAKPGGTNPPTFEKVTDNGAGSTGVYAWHFSPTTEQELFFYQECLHKWKEGTALKPHVHWSPIDTNTGNVVWGVELAIASINDAYGLTELFENTDSADGNALQNLICALGSVDMTGETISAGILGRIYRKAADAADTYASKAFATVLGIHIEIDRPGSREEFIK